MKKKIIRRHLSWFFTLFHKPLLFLFILVVLPISLWAVQQNQQFASIGAPTRMSPPLLHLLSLSESKLGVFMLGASNGGRKIASAGPKVIKVMDPQDNADLMGIIRDYKRNYPEGIVIARVYEGDARGYGVGDNPEQSAQDWWDKLLGPAVRKLSPPDKQLITYLAGPNEYVNTPIIKTSADAAWTGKFWARLAEIISDNGFKPLMGEIPVGNLDENLVADLVPALRKLKELGGAWSYHAYSLDYSTDENTESWTSLRYRKFYNYLRQNAPDVADIPMVLTEGGVDKSGNGQTDGWSARGSTQSYQNWLIWFDREIKNDPQIVGVTLFQIGNNSDWKSFNLESVSGWLADYLGGQPAQNVPTVPPQNNPSPVFIPPTVEFSIPTPVPTFLFPTTIPTQIPLPTSLSLPTIIIRVLTPVPTSTPIPAATLTPTPAPFVDVTKTIKSFQSLWGIIFIRLTEISKQILP